jgi:hypothetical protein
LIIDFDLIDICRTAFKIDDACFSDHLLLILSIRLSVNAPVIPVTHYKEIVDVKRLTAENVNKIQEKLCGTIPQLETQIEQITESEDESDKVKFYALVNEYAEIVKKTLKHTSKEIISQHRESRELSTGWTKKVRDLNKESRMCDIIMENLENDIVDFRNTSC